MYFEKNPPPPHPQKKTPLNVQPGLVLLFTGDLDEQEERAKQKKGRKRKRKQAIIDDEEEDDLDDVSDKKKGIDLLVNRGVRTDLCNIKLVKISRLEYVTK